MYANAQYYNDPITGYGPVAIRCNINGIPSSVPLDPDNTDYANIMQLVDEGKLTIAPAEDPAP